MLSIATISSTSFAGLAARAPMPVRMAASVKPDFDGIEYASGMAGIMPTETPGGDVGVFDPAGFLTQEVRCAAQALDIARRPPLSLSPVPHVRSPARRQGLTEEKLLFYREVELKHSRLAM